MYNKYECTKCISGYILDNQTKTCKENIINNIEVYPGLENCEIINIGKDPNNPIYSCNRCNSENDILVKVENGAKFCGYNYDSFYYYYYYSNDYYFYEYYDDYGLKGCNEASADTYYYQNNYNCNNCSINYILYNSKFFQRKKCQSIFENIKRKYNLNVSKFSETEEYVKAKNGVCENKKLFTPDNINCYSCSNSMIGMEGCKGSCTFSLERKNPIECEENGCKSGYIEISKGQCETCFSINFGCLECHYDEKYPENYKGLKRKRRFVCDQCDNGYLMSKDGTCNSCYYFGLSNCQKCKLDENKENKAICYQCRPGYTFTDNGNCEMYYYKPYVNIEGNKKIQCDDMTQGGIEGCGLCDNKNNKIICKKCKENLILNEQDNKCIKISTNAELEKLSHCLKYNSNNGKFECSLCEINSYVLLFGKDGNKCISYNNIPIHYNEYNQYCEIYQNLGTEDKPIYSCLKCIDDYYKNYRGDNLIRIIFKSNNTAFCQYSPSSKLENCSEAIMSPVNDYDNQYNCTKCYENNALKYDKYSNSYYCQYFISEPKCEISRCKKCKEDDKYVCEEIISDNYEIDPFTGFVIKKTEKIPAITWKDIYNLQMNQTRTINGKKFNGPSLYLRGITNSEISQGHTFLISLSFKLLNSKNNRRLQEQIEEKVPMLCQVLEDLDESKEELNEIDYYCIGNLTEEENKKLTNSNLSPYKIEEDKINNTDKLIPSNLDELNIDNINNYKPKYTLQNLVKTSIFIPDEIKNHTSKDYKFDFTMKGKLNHDIDKANLKVKIPLVEVDSSADCYLNIKENKNADLSCNINLESYSKSNYDTFSFKLSEYNDEEKTIVLSQINEVYLKSEKSNKKGLDKTILIIIICSSVAFVGIIIGIIIFIKRRKLSSSTVNPMVNIPISNLVKNPVGINPVKIAKKISKKSSKKHKKKNSIKQITKEIDDSKRKMQNFNNDKKLLRKKKINK